MTIWHVNQNDKIVKQLSKKDPKLGELIGLIGNVDFQTRPDRFRSLVRSITGQLISVAAAEAIFNRLDRALDGDITAESVKRLPDETIRECGFSRSKLQYLRDLQEKVCSGSLNLNELDNFDDQTVIKCLTDIKGIGAWTAHMFLIFSLKRQNILAIGDIGLQRAARWLYQVEQSKRKEALLVEGEKWSPHCTIASIYLWEAVQRGWLSYDSIEDLK
ncbi:DNA-3-methyladenine glycosylase II [Lentibacillus sp. JNUCC-1]|uniref:DNA-3-methyladenine glycosylase family protein n=1 Tax=Lentibacillus sp. JNUCC-1 TaxID=2654513 RepID=UPI0013242D19|nr:DNA-3-methyladenine glycosylase 2 family protein [Lentibacillus sp. JNUCC-1]MUV36322.1 DNA-3-methyladenine glycosylase II [Lentibacillus sp. JNUCC-1]